MNIKPWIHALRLRTLPLAISSILMGSFLAFRVGSLNLSVLVLSLLTTLFLQILSNLANDYGDSVSGVDHSDRVGPTRAVASGAISIKSIVRGILITGFLALLSGLILIRTALGDNWTQIMIFLILGLGAIAAALKYTIGTNPYGYAGWGDFFVFLFFGIVGVVGSFYLHTQKFEFSTLLPAISCGFFSVAVLNVNNIRDIDSDRKSGKRSIPVIIGKNKAVKYHFILIFVGAIASIFYIMITRMYYPLIFLLIFPLLWRNIQAVRNLTGKDLDPYLKQMALATLSYVLLFGLGIIFGGY